MVCPVDTSFLLFGGQFVIRMKEVQEFKLINSKYHSKLENIDSNANGKEKFWNFSGGSGVWRIP